MNPRSASVLALACALAYLAPAIALAAPFSAAAGAPIATALAALNSASRPTFVSAFTPDAAIIDEISPFRFAGEHAAAAWFDRLVAVNRDNSITGERSTASPTQAGSIEGDAAYAVVPVRIDYRQSGKAIVENGSWTFALKRENGTWKIAGAAFAPSATH